MKRGRCVQGEQFVGLGADQKKQMVEMMVNRNSLIRTVSDLPKSTFDPYSEEWSYGGEQGNRPAHQGGTCRIPERTGIQEDRDEERSGTVHESHHK